jgi:hypothetical protein
MFHKSIYKKPCENYLYDFITFAAKVEKIYTKVPKYFPEKMKVASHTLTISRRKVALWKENQT